MTLLKRAGSQRTGDATAGFSRTLRCEALVRIAFLAVSVCLSAGAQVKEPDACKLLTPADVSASLGEGFRPVMAGGPCNYVRRTDTATVYVRKASQGTGAKEIAFTRQAMPEAKAVPGVCEGALTTSTGSVVAAKGIWVVTVSTDIGRKHDPVAAAKLAALLCARM